MPIHKTYFKVSLNRPSSGGKRESVSAHSPGDFFFCIPSHTLVEWKQKNVTNSALIVLREDDILFGLPVSCLHTQKKKTIKVCAYLLVDMPKNFKICFLLIAAR